MRIKDFILDTRDRVRQIWNAPFTIQKLNDDLNAMNDNLGYDVASIKRKLDRVNIEDLEEVDLDELKDLDLHDVNKYGDRLDDLERWQDDAKCDYDDLESRVEDCEALEKDFLELRKRYEDLVEYVQCFLDDLMCNNGRYPDGMACTERKGHLHAHKQFGHPDTWTDEDNEKARAAEAAMLAKKG